MTNNQRNAELARVVRTMTMSESYGDRYKLYTYAEGLIYEYEDMIPLYTDEGGQSKLPNSHVCVH